MCFARESQEVLFNGFLAVIFFGRECLLLYGFITFEGCSAYILINIGIPIILSRTAVLIFCVGWDIGKGHYIRLSC